MQPGRMQSMGERGRIAWLVATIVVIVVLPAILLQRMTDAALEAASLVAHTNAVHAQVGLLLADSRAQESATLALAAGIDTPVIRERLARSTAAVPRRLDALEEMTRDNMSQQVRLGELRANLRQRERIARDMVTAASADTPALPSDLLAEARDLSTRYPIQDLVNGMVGEEQDLLAERLAESQKLQRRAHWLRAIAALAQLLVLTIIAYFWLRQMRGRIDAERGQRQADERARHMLQSVREPIVLLDPGLHVLMHNAAFSELYGEGDEEPSGVLLSEIGGGAWNDPALLQRIHDVLRRGRELWDFEHTQVTPDGRERTMLVNARQMPLPDTAEPVVLLTVSDITARKADEDRIRELNEQLTGKIDQVSEVNQELEAFSYSVSHDLRAPLRHIAGFADKLGRHLGDAADDKAAHYLDVMRKSAKRMSALIDDLLVYSRLGRSAMRLQAIDMQSLVQETRAMLDSNAASEAPEHRIEWRIAPLPMLVGDENMLRQVWLNLLGNAVKYSMPRQPAVIEVGHARLEDGSHEFTVRDNGVGFDMAYADKLFGVFQRMHKASEFGGTGIGLASVRRILSRHGGRISADATPGQGATFRFTLPPTLDAPRHPTGPKP